MESVELKWDLLGAKLTGLTCDEQGKFFTGFAAGLGEYDSGYHRQLQMCYAQDKLSENWLPLKMLLKPLRYK